jgi:Zn-dependent protease with chaperone function
VILPYALRLLCLCAGSFFFVHLALSVFARALAPWVMRRAELIGARRPAHSAAMLLLGLRLAPAALACATVAALCLPSFVSFESERGSEAAGIPFLAVAALGAAAWAISLARSLHAVVHSHRCFPSRSARLAGEPEAVWLSEGASPFLGLAGVLRPRVVVSQSVARALDADQLAAALRHERAHRAAGDNFKRLLLLMAPDALPGVPLFHAVERAWARFAEWAADDWAVAQDASRSISLAEALVRVARLGVAPKPSPLVSPFVPEGDDISRRVERLLNGPAPTTTHSPRFGAGWAVGALAAPFVAAIAAPGSLSAVHQLLERWMH